MAQDNDSITRGTPEQAREMWRFQQEREREQQAQAQREQRQMERSEQVSEVASSLRYGTQTDRSQIERIAGIAVDTNFTVNARRGAAENQTVNTAQAEAIGLAADFMANMSAGETLQYATTHLMPAFTTQQRNSVRYAAAAEAVGIYLRENYPNIEVQDTERLVQAAVPVARDIVRER